MSVKPIIADDLHMEENNRPQEQNSGD